MNVYVIIGEDDWLVGETAKKIIAGCDAVELIDSLNSSNADLQLSDLRKADASFSTPPFLDPQKVTWWKNVHFLPGGGGRQSAAEVKEALEKFARKVAAATLPDNQKFIITGPHLLKTSVFFKTISAVAEVTVFAPLKPWEAAKNAAVRVAEDAADMGLQFEKGAAEHFVSLVGVDSRSLKSELDKMRNYLEGVSSTITKSDIDEVASQGVGVEPEVWAITDALGARDLEKALSAVRRFEQENGFAVFISGVIEKFFRQLVDLKVAAGKGEFDKATSSMAPFAARKMAGFIRNWSLGELRVARWRFLKLRERAVTSSGGADVLVLIELVRVCARQGAK